MNETKSQNEEILRALQAGRKITALEALNDFKCMRLASRINDLRKEYPILDEWCVVPSGKRVKKYWMNVSNPSQPELFS